MNVQRDPDAILATWLEDGPVRLPDATKRAIAVTTRTTRQSRRPMWVPWRFPPMNGATRFALGAVAVVAVALGGLYLFNPAPGGVIGGPGPSRHACGIADPDAHAVPVGHVRRRRLSCRAHMSWTSRRVTVRPARRPRSGSPSRCRPAGRRTPPRRSCGTPTTTVASASMRWTTSSPTHVLPAERSSSLDWARPSTTWRQALPACPTSQRRPRPT